MIVPSAPRRCTILGMSKLVVGIDEVGRGCWAGPLVAAAVILPPNFSLQDGPVKLRDSKKMTKSQREVAAELINCHALAIGVGWVEAAAIDSGGITQAVKSAMEQALAAVTIEYGEVIVDGNYNYLASDVRARAVIKADDSIPAVSAASIIAKVARDRYMAAQSIIFPGYGFEDHVGYGTARHLRALQELGITELHRHSFKPIRALLELRT